MTPVSKYLWLIRLLLGKDGMTFREINERWLKHRRGKEDENIEIERRTFRNHIIAINKEYGIRIVCGSGYRYYIENPIKEVLPKLEHLSMQNRLSEIASNSKLSNNLFIDEYFYLLRNNNVTCIMDAIKMKRKILVSLWSYYGKNRVLNVSPYQLHYINAEWYLLGHADGLGLMRFPFHSFCEDVQTTDDSYNYPVNYSPVEYSKKIYGTTNERINVTVFIMESKPDYFSKYPLMPFQQDVEYGNRNKDGCESSSSQENYNVKITFNLPKTPFAVFALKGQIGNYKYTIINEKELSELFPEEQAAASIVHPVVLMKQ